VLVEVALVQLCAPPAAASDDVGALAARITALEQAVAAAPPAATAAPVDPSTGRAALGGRARASSSPSSRPPASTPPPAAAAEPSEVAVPSGDVDQEWSSIRPTLKGRARALYTPVDLVGSRGDTVTLAVPNAMHQSKCEEHRGEVEQAWSAATGRAITIEFVVADASGATPRPGPVDDRAHGGFSDDDVIDPTAGEPAAAPSVIERLAQAFPGAELVEGRES
jgi:hypothetical protein